MNKMKSFLCVMVVLLGGITLQHSTILAETKKETTAPKSSHLRACEIELRLSKREELDRLLLVLRTRKEALDSIGDLEGRNDVSDIERTVREEIDQLLIKIQRLAAELNEDNLEDLEELQSSGWITTTLTCSSLFLLSLLALSTMDPFDGIHFPPSTERLEKNVEKILGIFGY